MSSDSTQCAICEQDSHQSTLVHGLSEGREALFCMRCFHALMHGMPVEQLRQRWQEYQATCKH